ncbi:MAG TPA: LLM class flavin-dependent oxidoreductase [Solirubrobacterales bacterium]|nr:LLM class flavin-dependent oxidoreductase [Solirubrobacterales bacterium]
MKVGLFLDMRNPPEWQRDWHVLYEDWLERLARAERLGIDSVWLTEHHLFSDGYLSQPLTFAAAIASRTESMTIGTAIMQAKLRPAIDIAEQAALVDILSGGRLELGLGAGYRIPEWRAYGVDGKGRFEDLEATATEVRRLWDSGGATPPPVQPRVPIWIGGEGPRGARIAGRLGEGLLTLKPELLGPYREALSSHGHDPDTARMGGCANFILSDDPERDWPRIKRHLEHQWRTYFEYKSEGRAGPPLPSTDPDDLRSTTGPPVLPRFDVVTPEEAAERLRPWLLSMPVAHIYFWGSIAGMPDDLVERHLELLATELSPALRSLPSG